MRIGLPPPYSVLDSVKQVGRMTAAVLEPHHDLVYFPPQYDYCSREEQGRLTRQWLGNVDVILGPADHHSILQLRNETPVRPPYIGLLLGCLSRGAWTLFHSYEFLTSSDILVGNCRADIQLAHMFFENVQARLLPLAFDKAMFYPLSAQQRQAARERLGFRSDDNVLLYSGRITLEKNVHTLLKVFSLVEQMIPNTHLIIVGAESDVPFREFGVYPLSVRSMLDSVVKQLGIKRVKFLGHQNVQTLLYLYNTADLAVNMSLHHDENFGLAQIEAMACGTPVAATQWGGLKDTVVDGATGVLIGTIITGSGIKIDWWEAANKIVQLLRDSKQSLRFRENCARIASEKYSFHQYLRHLNAILSDSCDGRRKTAEPLRASKFALEFWRRTSVGPYTSNSHSYNMYRQLMQPFAGRSQNNSGNELSPSQILCLAVPIRIENDVIAIEDPIYPFEIAIPINLRKSIRVAAEIMSRKPATQAAALQAKGLDLKDALAWLIDAGVVLVSTHGDAAPDSMTARMGVPLFSMQGVNYNSDLVYIKQAG